MYPEVCRLSFRLIGIDWISAFDSRISHIDKRVLVPVDKQKRMEVKREAFDKIRKHEGTLQKFGATEDIDLEDDDDHSTGETANLMKRAGGLIADMGGKHFDGWKPRYRIPCHAITVESQHKNSVHLLVRLKELKQERELIFDTVEDANKFCSILNEERQNETVRSKARLQASLGEIKLAPHEKVSLLLEVVSGWDLPIGDLTTSDPYVVCMFGRREIHRTKYISGT